MLIFAVLTLKNKTASFYYFHDIFSIFIRFSWVVLFNYQ